MAHHVGQQRLDQSHHTEHIRLELKAQLIHGQLGERSQRAVARIVDQERHGDTIVLKTRLQAADTLRIHHIERGRPDTTRLKRTQNAHPARRGIHHMSPTVEFFGPARGRSPWSNP